MKMRSLLLSTVPVLGLATVSLAVPTITAAPFQNGSQTFYQPVVGDLIDDNAATFDSENHVNYTSAGGSDASFLNDGAAVTTNSLDEATYDSDGTWQSYFYLDLTTNTEGYDITKIESIAAWPGGRIGQTYEVLISKKNSATFASLGTFTLNYDGASNSSLLRLTDSSGILTNGPLIATNVDAIEFSVLPSSGTPSLNGGDPETVYREFDVFGTASPIPEPATAGLLVATLPLLARRRRV